MGKAHERAFIVANRVTLPGFVTKNKERENAKIVKDDSDFAFTMQHTPHTRSMSEWIMDSGTTKHMTSHRLAFDTYEVFI